MKTITATLSAMGINAIINHLQQVESDIQSGLSETVEILTQNAQAIAQVMDGEMATVTKDMPTPLTGVVEASGDAAIIAEFGAGDDTMIGIPFDNPPPVDVYPGSYSEQVGSGEYIASRLATGQGEWHFGGQRYTTVKPRKGLYIASQNVKNTYLSVAKGAIKL